MYCLNSGNGFLLCILFCIQAEQNRSMFLLHKTEAFCIQPQASYISKWRESDRRSARGQQHSASRQDSLFWSLHSPAAYRHAWGDPLPHWAGAQGELLCIPIPAPRATSFLLCLSPELSTRSPQEPCATCQLLHLYFCLRVVVLFFFKASCCSFLPFIIEMTQGFFTLMWLRSTFQSLHHCSAWVGHLGPLVAMNGFLLPCQHRLSVLPERWADDL